MPRVYSSRRSAITFSIISTSSTCGLVRWALAALDALLWALALPLCKRGHQRALAWQPANPEALGVDTRLGRLLVHAAGAAVGAREARVREDATQHQSALPRREFCLLLLASYFLLLTSHFLLLTCTGASCLLLVDLIYISRFWVRVASSRSPAPLGSSPLPSPLPPSRSAHPAVLRSRPATADACGNSIQTSPPSSEDGALIRQRVVAAGSANVCRFGSRPW